MNRHRLKQQVDGNKMPSETPKGFRRHWRRRYQAV
uniref:Uncharacterized protein n=1 Tax=Neisseria meningitidis alpha522 TaxID=996307 RepID=I4E3J4_NEIME|nr:hypothetical protein NMALPHA522_0367 [Neisseria meningitidis alpha522]